MEQQGIGMHLYFIAELPEARIRGLEGAFYLCQEPGDDLRITALLREDQPLIRIQGKQAYQHLSIDIVLRLDIGLVPDPNRFVSQVAGEVEAYFEQLPVPADGI